MTTMKSLRLPLENGKYAYIEVKAVFTNCMEVHIVDRTNVKSGVSIIDCIEEVQEKIIKEFGAKDFVMNFLQNSKWFLYGKNGKVGDYSTIEGVRELQTFDATLNQELVQIAMERSEALLAKIKVKKAKTAKKATKEKTTPKRDLREMKFDTVEKISIVAAAFIPMDLVGEQLSLF